jgi:toxin-antitoxin system PIN domain toxin
VILLLDVNVLVALAHEGHAEHRRVSRWYASLQNPGIQLATCSITELGFVRVSVQTGLEESVPEAVDTLTSMVASSRIPFLRIADDLGATDLPAHVRGPKQVTDGHLLALARRHKGSLVTLDRGIPGGVTIP